MKKVATHTAVEKSIQKYMVGAIYSAVEDRRAKRAAHGATERSDLFYETYANSLLNKKERKNLNPWIRFTTKQVQMLRQLLEDYCGEVQSVVLSPHMTSEQLTEEILGGDTPVATAVLAANPAVGPILAAYHDNQQMASTIHNRLTTYAQSAQLAGRLVDYFMAFLRWLAGTLVLFSWHDQAGGMDAIWRPILEQRGIPANILDEYELNLRKKAPSKPKKAKIVTATEVVTPPTADILF
jgi:hypothetical protein